MNSPILQALREEVEDNKHTRDPIKIAVNTALKRVANRLEKLLEERHARRIAHEEQNAQDERDAFNEAMGDGQH